VFDAISLNAGFCGVNTFIHNYSLAPTNILCNTVRMDRTNLMQSVVDAAVEKRVDMSRLCNKAGVSQTIYHRFKRGECVPRLSTIGKLEKALQELAA
jgi:DNA-binding phage protein